MKKLILLALMLGSVLAGQAQKKGAKYYYDHALVQSDLNKVVADMTKAIELKPDYRDAYMYRGVAYMNNKAVPKAIADFNKVISMNPNSPDIYFYRAQANEKQQAMTAAMSDYNKAIQLSPNFADAYYRRGLLLKQQGKSGCEDIRKAKKLGYKVPDADIDACTQPEKTKDRK